MERNYKESVKWLESYLDMDRKPVGIRILWTEEEFNEFNANIRPTRITYCNAVQEASKGATFKLTDDHMACGNGATALGFRKYPDKLIQGFGRKAKGIYNDVPTSRSVSYDMRFIQTTPYAVGIKPLEQWDYKEDPHVVIVVSQTYNIMRLIQGYGHFHGYAKGLKTCGLQALCHDLTTYPLITDDINISLLCPGTRQVANWTLNEIGIGIAFSKWYDSVEGVAKTTNPFERNPNKEEIKKRLDANGLDSSGIVMNENYDTGTYKGGRVEVK